MATNKEKTKAKAEAAAKKKADAEAKKKANSAKKKVKKVKPLKTSKDYEEKGKYHSLDQFWAVMAHKNKLKPNWKSAFKAHIKKMGFDSSDKYEAGLKHFLGKK